MIKSIFISGVSAPVDCYDCELTCLYYQIDGPCPPPTHNKRPVGCPITEIETETQDEIARLIAAWEAHDGK